MRRTGRELLLPLGCTLVADPVPRHGVALKVPVAGTFGELVRAVTSEDVQQVYDRELRQSYDEARQDLYGVLRQTVDQALYYRRALAEVDLAIAEKYRAIAEKDRALAEMDRAIAEPKRAIAEQNRAIAEKELLIAQLTAALEAVRSQPTASGQPGPSSVPQV
ncbi:hypothetical protein NUW54_g2817 [Trametes sanguinea]|uniref:Uncharacterized protein n=1 Tax=Trametes sanguinea TaxID=158606 RepID=A0ACC1Q2H7_9APHY|nr:hypothetical protein NUW54_g2817 [Trametes sanguinea]